MLEQDLSRFVTSLDWDDIPPSTQRKVQDIWVDAVANTLAGRRAQNTPVIEGLARRLCGDGDSTIVGGDTLSMTGAALVNGFQVTAYTMCDVYRPALCHVTPELLPPLLAVAEQLDAPGREVLTAFAAGLEVTTRLGLGLDYERFRARGWHSPGVIGPFGGAAAAARLLKLDEDQLRRALGLAGSQASGTFAALGTPAVKFHQSRGAVSALWAAQFAADGLGGSPRVLTHPDGGLLSTYADGGAPELVTAELGRRWELEQISLRRWPAASSLQALVACTLEVAPRVSPSQVRELIVSLPPASFAMCAEMGWADELSAMQSARFVAAVVLHDRRCWVEQFTAARRTDPVVSRFAEQCVTVHADPDLPPSGAVLSIRPAGLTARHGVARGEPGDPLSREEIAAKLADAAAAVPPAAGDALARSLDETVTMPGTAGLCAGLRGRRAEGARR